MRWGSETKLRMIFSGLLEKKMWIMLNHKLFPFHRIHLLAFKGLIRRIMDQNLMMQKLLELLTLGETAVLLRGKDYSLERDWRQTIWTLVAERLWYKWKNKVPSYSENIRFLIDRKFNRQSLHLYQIKSNKRIMGIQFWGNPSIRTWILKLKKAKLAMRIVIKFSPINYW